MNSSTLTIKIFIWILILLSVKIIFNSSTYFLPINQEMGGGLILPRFFTAELMLQFAYLISGISILKNKLWAWYPTCIFLVIGISLQILKQDISLAVFYIIVVALLIIDKFFNKKIKQQKIS